MKTADVIHLFITFIICSACFCSLRMIFDANGTKMNMNSWPRGESRKRERKKMVSKYNVVTFQYLFCKSRKVNWDTFS